MRWVLICYTFIALQGTCSEMGTYIAVQGTCSEMGTYIAVQGTCSEMGTYKLQVIYFHSFTGHL